MQLFWLFLAMIGLGFVLNYIIYFMSGRNDREAYARRINGYDANEKKHDKVKFIIESVLMGIVLILILSLFRWAC